MDEHYEKDLERWAQQQLRSLPELKAPATLMPRVRQAIMAQAEKYWWRRPWRHWPRSARFLTVASLVFAAVFGVFGVLVWHQLGLEMATEFVLGELGLTTAYQAATTLCGAMASAARHYIGPIWLYVASTCFVMYLSCLGIGTACVRLACNPSFIRKHHELT